MPKPEAKISEVEPAEAQQVVDALVRDWVHYRKPERDDTQLFRPEDIAVEKVTIPEISYPIYICVPRAIRAGQKTDVLNIDSDISVAAPFMDTGIVSFVSVLFRAEMIQEAMENNHAHTYNSGWQRHVAMPDNSSISRPVDPFDVEKTLQGSQIQSMMIMCGFHRRIAGQSFSQANIAIFTNPSVK